MKYKLNKQCKWLILTVMVVTKILQCQNLKIVLNIVLNGPILAISAHDIYAFPITFSIVISIQLAKQ